MALLVRTIRIPEQYRQIYRRAEPVLALSSVVIVLLGFSQLGAIPLLVT